MKNFEKDNFKSADTGIVGFMIRVDDDRYEKNGGQADEKL